MNLDTAPSSSSVSAPALARPRERPIFCCLDEAAAFASDRKTVLRRPLVTIAAAHSQQQRLVRLPGTTSAIYLDYKIQGLSWFPYSGSEIQPWPADRLGEVCPFGGHGDKLWVRESWGIMHEHESTLSEHEQLADARQQMPWASVIYRATETYHEPKRWRAPLSVPRWAARMMLKIISVRLEHLHDITEDDAKAEGCSGWIPTHATTGLRGVRAGGLLRQVTSREHFQLLWDAVHRRRDLWSTNPWVWRLEVQKVALR
ncbi:MAG: hypothetical protein ACHREM_02335 [Polyangiales bacterium]